MILLPRGNPIKEGLNPARVNLPGALKKLQTGRFTGYLRFETGPGTGVLIYEKGKLVSALFEGLGERVVAEDAIERIFDESQQGDARLDIYKLAPEVALSIHALLHGELLYQGQDLKLIDIKALLARIKEKRMNGCLRIYADDRIALIFYDQGHALGFFHDGSSEIEKTADTSMSVARLPGAKIDVLSARNLEELMLTDLQHSSDLVSLWQNSRVRHQEKLRKFEEQQGRINEERDRQRRKNVQDYLRETAHKHLGQTGAGLAGKEFERTVKSEGPMTEASLVDFYVKFNKAARMLAGSSAVNRMLEEMKRGVKARLQQDS
ncbi:MAG: GTPase-activating protein [Geoalkalibacter sp.]|jgi:hypothetical protein|uniref:GTPase-activating protein n=1 Tax=Geoalkalibacter sp. TaxID=3041440 RepID=UPI003D0CB632